MCVCVCVCVCLRGIQVLLRELGHSPSRAAAGPESGLGVRLFYSLTLTFAAYLYLYLDIAVTST